MSQHNEDMARSASSSQPWYRREMWLTVSLAGFLVSALALVAPRSAGMWFIGSGVVLIGIGVVLLVVKEVKSAR